MNENIWWAIHNIIGHPLMEILGWISNDWGSRIHNATLPPDVKRYMRDHDVTTSAHDKFFVNQ